MEADVSGGTAPEADLPRSNYGELLDSLCPRFLLYGMTWDEFWYESLDRLGTYWQKYQFQVEARNQEMWIQGVYIHAAIASFLDKAARYPETAPRITEMTPDEREADNRRRIQRLREQLNAIKLRSDLRAKGGGDEP